MPTKMTGSAVGKLQILGPSSTIHPSSLHRPQLPPALEKITPIRSECPLSTYLGKHTYNNLSGQQQSLEHLVAQNIREHGTVAQRQPPSLRCAMAFYHQSIRQSKEFTVDTLLTGLDWTGLTLSAQRYRAARKFGSPPPGLCANHSGRRSNQCAQGGPPSFHPSALRRSTVDPKNTLRPSHIRRNLFQD